MKISSLSSGGRGRQGWFLLWLLLMTWSGWLGVGPVEGAGQAEKNRASVYDILGVEVSVPMSPKGMDATREAGVAQAQNEGMQRLYRRLLTSADQEAHKAFLQGLLADAKRLTERLVVRSEKQQGDRLTMSVDLMLSKKAVSEALIAQNVSYNETPYPSILLLTKETFSAGVGESQSAADVLQGALFSAAREYGLVLMQPLGDLEDLTHLTWEKAVQGDAEVLSWVQSRYGATTVWALQVDADSKSLKNGAVRLKVAGTLVVSQPDGAPVTSQALEEKSGKSGEELASPVYAALATKLVQSVMEGWIQGHALHPGLQHPVHLRVVHDAQLARLTTFLQGLRKIPGVKEPQVVNSTARETQFVFDYQGNDEVLQELLGKMGVHLELTPAQFSLWLVTAPTPAATVEPPAPPLEEKPAPSGEAPPPNRWL